MMIDRVAPYKDETICRTRADAVALQAFARGLPSCARARVKAALYPDRSGTGRFRVTFTVARMGLLDGGPAIAAFRAHVKASTTGQVPRADRWIPLIGEVA